jgi:centromere protein I
MLLRPDAEASTRISNWLMACLADVASGDVEPGLLLEMVDVVHEYTLDTKVCRRDAQASTTHTPTELTRVQALPPLLLTCIGQFLNIWKGSTKREALLETLSFAPLVDFNGKFFLQAVRRESKAWLTSTQIYTKALWSRWSTRYWTTRPHLRLPS